MDWVFGNGDERTTALILCSIFVVQVSISGFHTVAKIGSAKRDMINVIDYSFIASKKGNKLGRNSVPYGVVYLAHVYRVKLSIY